MKHLWAGRWPCRLLRGRDWWARAGAVRFFTPPPALREPFKAPARRLRVSARRRVAALTGRSPPSCCVAMDIGADEFEQSLPLLQELVLGADFVGKAPGSQALAPELAGRLAWGGYGSRAAPGGRGEAQPGGLQAAGDSSRAPRKDSGTPQVWAVECWSAVPFVAPV